MDNIFDINRDNTIQSNGLIMKLLQWNAKGILNHLHRAGIYESASVYREMKTDGIKSAHEGAQLETTFTP